MQSWSIATLSPETEHSLMPLAIPKPVLKWMKIGGAVVLSGGVLIFAGIFLFSRTLTLSGKVISAETKMPVEGALVYVHSGAPYEEDGLNTYARSDGNGSFTVAARGDVLLRAWKPGYALRGVNLGNAPALSRREIIIELRELTHTNLVTEHQGFYHFKPGDGFSFKLAKVVPGDSVDADIVLAQDLADRTTAYLQVGGEGGITFQPWNNETDFDNSPEAPPAGYEQSNLVQPERGIHFVRTRDGKHYAKFMLLVDLTHPPSGSPYLDLEYSQLIWAYQPDGTRSLDIAPGKNLSFPVEEFGLKREALEQFTK
jgi:hypothetical protein